MKKWIVACMVLLQITDSSFAPNIIQAAKGQSITLEIRNIGKAQHNFIMPELGVYSHNLRSGERMKMIIKADKSGSYEFFSDAPGAPETGLKGKLIVK